MNKIQYYEMLYLAGYFKYSALHPDPLKGIDIKKEYQLIQQKKSNLSANLRKMVVTRYNVLTKKKKEANDE